MSDSTEMRNYGRAVKLTDRLRAQGFEVSWYDYGWRALRPDDVSEATGKPRIIHQGETLKELIAFTVAIEWAHEVVFGEKDD